MRIFVTGASGHIGSLVVHELLTHGHQVTGLARSDASAAALTAAGAAVVRGTLDDLDVLASAAAEADGVAHLAFKHDFGDYAAAAEADLRAVEAMGAALAGSGRPFVTTSGTAVLALGGAAGAGSAEPSTEDTPVDPSAPRAASENATLALAQRDVRASIIRLAPTVHGPTDFHGFIPTLIAHARKTGAAIHVGDGANRWPAVDNRDAARLFRLAVESAPAGTRLHGAAEEGVPFRAIAQAIGERLDVPVISVSAEEAIDQLAFIGVVAALDNPTSSATTQRLLGWQPEHPSLLEDLAAAHYFEQ
ncbi:SDR family oxidoreductase [Mycobacterium sp. ACS4331]|uniref:SDR family oxidoreductase n=1 Tax=Mycobacterium sp. ACS4331 TaxID=1834121 RepID=UPI0007FD6269|nr:SDR family oxidoreductase [Mycobacterium sp. ACS4331]OBF25273.1 3-beta hydroxysteroid dehydrogenase [Mycobacterium sp. ACS4331]